MGINNPYQTYKENSVTTASPGELTLMLYNGCLKFINRARQAIEIKNIEQKNINLIKAQNIITELMVTLNMEYEISHQIIQLYEYSLSRLREANVKSDTEILDEVEGIVTELRDAWKQVIQINRKKQFGTGL